MVTGITLYYIIQTCDKHQPSTTIEQIAANHQLLAPNYPTKALFSFAPVPQLPEKVVSLPKQPVERYSRMKNTSMTSNDQQSNYIKIISDLLYCSRMFISGWWFQTFFTFHNIWDVILPN